jgi:hypothetical protein
MDFDDYEKQIGKALLDYQEKEGPAQMFYKKAKNQIDMY